MSAASHEGGRTTPLARSFERPEYSYAARYLLRQMRLTRAQWFEGNRRWQRRFQMSVFTQAWLALTMIVQSLLSLQMPPESPTGRVLLNLSGISTAVFLLALSLIETWQDYRKKGDQMFDGAQAIGRVHDRLRNALELDPKNHDCVVDATTEYHDILGKVPLGHEQVDFKNAILSNADFGPLGRFRRFWLSSETFLRRAFSLYVTYGAIMGTPPMLTWWAYRWIP